jgi:hypothetical protein
MVVPEDLRDKLYEFGKKIIRYHTTECSWRQVFRPPSSFMYLFGKDISVRDFPLPKGGTTVTVCQG